MKSRPVERTDKEIHMKDVITFSLAHIEVGKTLWFTLIPDCQGCASSTTTTEWSRQEGVRPCLKLLLLFE